MKKLSKITDNLLGQPMFGLLSRAKEMERAGKKILHFEIGDPNFDSPDEVVKAAKLALDNKETHYASSMGLWELRQEICNFTKKELGFLPLMGQVLVMPANAAIDFIIRCVANPGDEIIYPDPGFCTYFSVINYGGFKPIPVPLKEENKFRMNVVDIKKAITEKTKLIIINSPNNPTGSMLAEKDVKEIFEIAKERNIFLLSDEVYSKIVYDNPHYSPSVYDQCKERVIVLNSFSKIYSMSGWRLGYVVGPEALISKMGLLFETIFSCAPPFIQRAGITALASSACQELVKTRNKELKKRRDILVKGLNKIPGINCLLPDGSFYAFANIKKTGFTSSQLMNLLLDKAQVAVLDGEYFGNYGKDHIRLCYASMSAEKIEEALEKIKKFMLNNKIKK
jgi:aspartate aminotransferase